jgi:hypothetical protein
MYVACIHSYTPQQVAFCQVGTSGSHKFDTSVLYVYTSVQDHLSGLKELQNWGASYTKT